MLKDNRYSLTEYVHGKDKELQDYHRSLMQKASSAHLTCTLQKGLLSNGEIRFTHRHSAYLQRTAKRVAEYIA